jgi:hypothetical protein
MVLLYTAIAAGTGPTADDQIEGEIEQAVLETNVAFSQSGMSVRVVLTHMEKVSVAEPADAVLLTGLTNGTGPLAVAHNLGNAHYADVVGLVTSREGGTGNTMFVPAMSHRDQAFFIAGRSNMDTASRSPTNSASPRWRPQTGPRPHRVCTCAHTSAPPA